METVLASSGHVWHGGQLISYRIDDRRRSAARPAILVVVPYYNARAWIDQCLERLSANNEPHDIIIVDDGSEEAFVPPANCENIIVCRFARNAGLITALNFAVSFATQQGYTYYVRQDADDLSHADRLQRQREAIEREGADIVVSGVTAVDETGATIWRGRMDIDEAAFQRMLMSRNPAVHSTWFLRTDVFARIGCYDERFKGAEDFELLQRIAQRGRIAIVPEELVDYLVRAGSVLSTSRRPALQTLRIVANRFDRLKPSSYFGIARAGIAVLASRNLKTAARHLLSRLNQ